MISLARYAILSSSAVERSTVNRLVTSSNLVWGVLDESHFQTLDA